ncbi:S8 family serine peptidase [Cellulomonas sp. JZ18]|uniref:S8 family peptidase n=1 Tax=Cellulomonas sp. JZ18 TaxID=2654191 RepID=UPI0012D3730B|nr:S8 family peptidase [Cellulomonas sp. JZ18]QGQ19284.1 S8 family serine peptidase [Cellulomonas sp. JZ18]
MRWPSGPEGEDPSDVTRAPGPVPAGVRATVRSSPGLVADSVLARPLADRMAEAGTADLLDVTIELNTFHPGGLTGAAHDARTLLGEVAPGRPVRTTTLYLTVELTADEIRHLVHADEHAARDARAAAAAGGDPRQGVPVRPGAPRRAVHRIWPNFRTHVLIHRTVVTTKCAAAQRSFDASGEGVVWAVLDSGIDGEHAHFRTHGTLDGDLHRSFVPGTTDDDALTDEAGHGTHVAGIIAGEQTDARPPGSDEPAPVVAATWYRTGDDATGVERVVLRRVAGMAPRCRLVSCKVLRADGSGDVAALLEALEYVQTLNRGGADLQVHGVNLSVGYPFSPEWFATGLTPVCREVDRLVRSGVVVVVAAGNTGGGYALDSRRRQVQMGFDMTINDPGNAEQALTVGATSTSPHSTGISYFSSKGPTGDGRLKPDLVAPGERVLSAGTGALLAEARQGVDDATYVENSGTSMAAPHVSGVAAAFLSVHREFVGRPDDVKRILMSTASDLGRARTFQGAGLVDAMRAIQSI